MSRRAWPRPIGEDTKSARRGRSGARVQRRCATGRAPSTRAANSSISTFTFTGSRAFSPWPDPSSTTSSPPVSSATRRPRSSGVMRSRSPWIDEHRAADARTSSFSACSRVISAAGESFVCSSTERPASRPQPTQSSTCFSEWGSGNISRTKNSTKPGKSRRHEARREARPALVVPGVLLEGMLVPPRVVGRQRRHGGGERDHAGDAVRVQRGGEQRGRGAERQPRPRARAPSPWRRAPPRRPGRRGRRAPGPPAGPSARCRARRT